MRLIAGYSLCIVLALPGAAQRAVKPERPPAKVASRGAAPGPKGGIKTPGVQIPFASLKSELEFATPIAPDWIGVTDAIFIRNHAADGLDRIDPRGKEAKPGDPVAGIAKPCSSVITAFNSLWVPSCADGMLMRVDPKTNKITAKVATGIGSARPGIAASADSVWVLSDGRGTLSRVDPQGNTVVAEFRVPADCNTLTFGETALWLTCPAENRVIRVDPSGNLVEKSIEVSAQPEALAIGETSVWVLCAKDGKLERIDPKTNKVSKTIELGAPAPGGSITIGDGFAWVAMPGFPITRIDPANDKVAQQFYGDAFGPLQSGLGFLWLADHKSGKLLKIDPKRVVATLAE